MKIQLSHGFEDIISVENLLLAWQEFIKGKRNKADVQQFLLNLIDNILQLHWELANKTYQHGGYHAFNISDPKPRNIHKASVRDRLVHHAIYRILYPFFDRVFIADSYSCRKEKGLHRAINRFRHFAYKVSQNNTKTCWVLQCDIRKFFASIDQGVLLGILSSYINPVIASEPLGERGNLNGIASPAARNDTMWLLEGVIKSFSSQEMGKGLPLGNLTSQLFVNIYMNEFDQFIKHKLKVKHYIRYADDFVFLSDSMCILENYIPKIQNFLSGRLKLEVHKDKVRIKTLSSGIDFLGWVHFPDHRVFRTRTRRRMIRRIEDSQNEETLQSYLGLLSHGNTHKLQDGIIKLKQLF